MTAEIAILNRSAVAMAADSAVTMRLESREKIFPTANKIFALSSTEPVGIMVYGDAEFMSVPWETIIKVLRQRLGSASFSKLTEYAEWFRETLATSSDLLVGDATEEYIAQCVGSYFSYLIIETKNRIQRYIEEHKEISEPQVADLLAEVVAKHVDHWRDGKLIRGVSAAKVREIRSHLKAPVERLIDQFFKLPMTGRVRADLHCIAEYLFTRDSKFRRVSDSGVVIAGFGRDELVPALTSVEVRGCFRGVLQWRQGHEFSMEEMRYGVIVPFAQTDEVQSFLDGVHPDYHQRLDQDFKMILDRAADILLNEVEDSDPAGKERAKKRATQKIQTAYREYRERLDQFRREQYSNPILHVLAGTPKDQLASMAEAMVNLTSFKRRVSTQAETVGGPIDVALISKGDGLVWVKRKHYFPQELNPQFLARYNRRNP